MKATTSALLLSAAFAAAALLVAACGGGAAKPAGGESQPAAAAGGNADSGKKLFNEPVIASAGSPGCITCHSLEKGKTLVGPSMVLVPLVGGVIVDLFSYQVLFLTCLLFGGLGFIYVLFKVQEPRKNLF